MANQRIVGRAAANKPIACMTPKCGKACRNRGMCPACESRHFTDVKNGRDTWEDIVARGEALPSKGKSAFTDSKLGDSNFKSRTSGNAE